MPRCPRCYGRDIHKSKAKGFGERLGWWLVMRRPVRCYGCSFRFTAWIFSRAKPRLRLREYAGGHLSEDKDAVA
jgi:hypothetical protein